MSSKCIHSPISFSQVPFSDCLPWPISSRKHCHMEPTKCRGARRRHHATCTPPAECGTGSTSRCRPIVPVCTGVDSKRVGRRVGQWKLRVVDHPGGSSGRSVRSPLHCVPRALPPPQRGSAARPAWAAAAYSPKISSAFGDFKPQMTSKHQNGTNMTK